MINNIANLSTRVNKDLSEHVEIHRMPSNEFYDQVKNKVFDYIHIDGNHSYDRVKEDLNLYLPLLRKDGILCMDDLAWPTVNKAFQEEKKDFLTKIKDAHNWALFRKL